MSVFVCVYIYIYIVALFGLSSVTDLDSRVDQTRRVMFVVGITSQILV